MRRAWVVTFIALGACSARAQPGRRSQRGTVTQSINGTEISIRYFRPVLRGRTPFPDVVNWGRTWTPGADSATRVETTGDLEIEGKTLPQGKYSLWLIPQEKDAWTVIFNRSANAFHLSYNEGEDALRVQARPTTSAQPVETLEISFPLVDADSAVMQMQWGPVVLPLHVHAR
ncbi:MAG TPA: DUF2911 domain-containing protein [Gemmatimonadaceae bacterium]